VGTWGHGGFRCSEYVAQDFVLGSRFFVRTMAGRK